MAHREVVPRSVVDERGDHLHQPTADASALPAGSGPVWR
jgi:hypothetical protein